MSNPRNATLPRGERLIIRISPGSLSFTTTGAGQVNYERYALKSSISMAANMREALRNTPVLEADYQHVAVMVDSPVLMIPVGGFYTIDASQARKVAEALNPRIILPMHYRTNYNADWPISGPEPFLEQFNPDDLCSGAEALRVTKADLDCQPKAVLFREP